LQTQFDEENRLLLAERVELEAAAQRVFDCGVCMDTLPEEWIARIDPCGHAFCRDCVHGFVASQIESRRFPVLCPTCTAEPGSKPESIGSRYRYAEDWRQFLTDDGILSVVEVTRALVLDIGISEEQYETWVEMEMLEFLIRLQCRR
jgi:RING-type zinc-finger